MTPEEILRTARGATPEDTSRIRELYDAIMAERALVRELSAICQDLKRQVDETRRELEDVTVLKAEVERLKKDIDEGITLLGYMKERDALKARVAELEKVLKEVEWGHSTLYGDDERFYCPWCHADYGGGHKKDCGLSALLTPPSGSGEGRRDGEG